MKRIIPLLFSFCFPILLLAQHTTAALGISGRHLSENMAENREVQPAFGTYVYNVYRNSAADELGLQVFDYVYQINKDIVNDSTSINDLLSKYQAGDQVSVTYLRQGRQITENTTLSNRNELERTHRSGSKDPFLGVESVHKKINKKVKGVPVNVIPNSTAWAMGIEAGDVITKVDDYKVVSWDDLGAAIDDREVGDYIELEVYRQGETISFNRPIKSRAATHNDHSRGPSLNPPIAGADNPDAPDSKATITVAENEEIEQLAEQADMEMPSNNSLQVSQLNVFPNPNTGIFDLNLDLPEEGATNIRIFSPTGQLIYENNLGEFSGLFSDRIDIANNAKGIYFLAITQRDNIVTRKIILQ